MGVTPERPQRKRIPTACEACRVSKTRCLPSDRPGTCKKCFETKRECVSRTCPRPSRPRKYGPIPGAPVSVQPPTAASTFSIDFPMPTMPDPDDNFDAVRDFHEDAIENLFPYDEETTSSSSTSKMQREFNPTSGGQSMYQGRTKPLFNLASAESLLKSFQAMTSYFPFMVLPPETSVAELSASQPFLLLAMLAAASGLRSVQGHSLYDEEFRKVLGMKYVADGERNIEILQAIMIYCAWYPFHLRPRNKQAFQYMRMASDVALDLKLEQKYPVNVPPTSEQLTSIRTYVGHFYILSTFVVTWKRGGKIQIEWTSWTSQCCDLLDQYAEANGDHVLATMARISGILWQASRAMSPDGGQSCAETRQTLNGLAAQVQQLRATTPDYISSHVQVKLQLAFVDSYIDGGTVLGLHKSLTYQTFLNNPFASEASAFQRASISLRSLYDYLLSLSEDSFACLTLVDWSRLIIGIILGVRLSFNFDECPGFDSAWARSQLRLDQFLEAMCESREKEKAPSSPVNVLSASRIVMTMVLRKYKRRLDAIQEGADTTPPAARGCPMLDGSLSEYESFWNGPFVPSEYGEQNWYPEQQEFEDLWTTMNMTWAQAS